MTMSSSNNIIVENFAKIKLPSFDERTVTSSKWVRYGDDNLFPNFLQSLANRSALNGAIISSKVDYAFADGLKLNEKAPFSTELVYMQPNPYEDLNSIYKKLLYDFVLYGGCAVEVIFDRKKDAIAELYHVDFAKLRCEKNDIDGVVNGYYYSTDWLTYATKKTEYIPAFNVNEQNDRQILYVKEYRPGSYYYPLPSYVGALNYIATDCEISNYHLSHITNGMAPNYLINFNNGVPSEEERRKVRNQLVREYTGTDNAGKFILTFNDSAEQAPTVTTLSADNLDEQFIQLQDTVLQNILSAHKVVSPLLVGIKTAGQLGGANELKNAYSIYYENVIRGIQDAVVGKLNYLLKYTRGADVNSNVAATRRIINFE